MNSEKVKEIKKALENCQKNNCLDCPYFIDEKRCRANDLLLDTLTLINELESENERLQNESNEMFDKYGKELQATTILIEKRNNEITALKDRIAELEGEITKLDIINSKLEMDIELLNKQNIDLEIDRDYYQEQFNEQEDFYVEWNKQQLKQFAERLKEDIEHHHGNYGDLSDSECNYVIDETLKEFINKGDEER